MSFDRITRITKEVYEGYMPKGTKLHASKELIDRIFEKWSPHITNRPTDPDYCIEYGLPLASLYPGISLVQDNSIENKNEWVLCDAAGDEIERGVVNEECPN